MPTHGDDSFEIANISDILRRIDQTVLGFIQREGSCSPALRRAYEAYYRDVQALWRIVIVEAKAAGVSAAEIRAVGQRGYTMQMIMDALRAHGRERRNDAVTAVHHRSTTNSRSAKRRGRDIRKSAAEGDARITTEATAYRRRHPYSRAHSTRKLAKALAGKTRRSEHGIRDALKRLKIR